jgi:hypothetical protein
LGSKGGGKVWGNNFQMVAYWEYWLQKVALGQKADFIYQKKSIRL